MFRRVTQISMLAMLTAGSVVQAHAHAVLLPQIDVGGQRKMVSVPHKHVAPATKPVSAPRASAPAVAQIIRSPASDQTSGGGPSDPNNSFASSAQQDRALGPKINYPAPPRELPSSSERFFTGGQVNTIPTFRPGEALEIVPGLAVTQHSGEGKANQYYLRGFDLDHGTDLALYLDSMPLNMRTHGHGQGYADIIFWSRKCSPMSMPARAPTMSRMAIFPTPARSGCNICKKCRRAFSPPQAAHLVMDASLA
jgi:hypothetical protein